MHIEYLCFHADRISFEPSKDQVIFFIPRNRHYRMGLSLIKYVDDNYGLIVNEFQQKGLEFVFLPRATKELNIPELYKYFRPDADEQDIRNYQKGFFPEDLLNFLILKHIKLFLLTPQVVLYEIPLQKLRRNVLNAFIKHFTALVQTYLTFPPKPLILRMFATSFAVVL